MSSRTVHECDRCGKESTLSTRRLLMCKAPMAEWIKSDIELCYNCEKELDPILIKHRNEINDWMMKGNRYGNGKD